MPEAHSVPLAHVSPLARRGAQVPPLQNAVGLQSALSAQPCRQLLAVPLHQVAPHSLPVSVPAASGEQVPTFPATLQASQVPAQPVSQQTPSTHEAVMHSLAAAQLAPAALRGAQLPAAQYSPGLHWLSLLQLAAQPELAQYSPPHSASGSVPDSHEVQVPTTPRTAQERQAPAQPESQQTPSTHCPEPHSLAAPHATPRGRFSAQKPLRQKAPCAHSLSFPQGWGQSSSEPLQASGEQLGVPGAPEATGRQVPVVPVPSQRSHAPAQGVLQQTPSAHAPVAHTAAEAHAVPCALSGTHAGAWQKVPSGQPCVELQAPGQSPDWPSQVAPPQAGWPGLPAGKVLQSPTAPGTAQLLQPPRQLDSQQTPSTQWLERHSAACWQDWPLDLRGMHWPCRQRFAASHSLFFVQPVGQVVSAPLQANGAQVGVPWVPAWAGPQVPAKPGRSHRSQALPQAESQQTPSAQKPEAQSAARVQAWPGASFCTQALPTHSAPGAQSAVLLQPTAQLPVAVHRAPEQSGSAVPASTGAQVPFTLPSQRAQAPPQRDSQQVPSTQNPGAQAASLPHEAPAGCFGAQVPPSRYSLPVQPTHAPASQDWPGSHCTP